MALTKVDLTALPSGLQMVPQTGQMMVDSMVPQLDVQRASRMVDQLAGWLADQ
jgi:hypothetical protein